MALGLVLGAGGIVFAGDQWWVFLLFAGLAALLTWAAFALSARRDLGAGPCS